MARNVSASARRLVVAHPSTELYGADQQMLASLRAARAAGWDVTVVLPARGALAPLAAETGARVVIAPFPVLRKSLLTPRGLIGLVSASCVAAVRAARWLRATGAQALYVSTLTAPTWIAAARLARVPVLCHVHEAEDDQGWLVTAGLTAPLLGAQAIVTNSAAARRSIGRAFGSLAKRARVVHNGLEGPPAAPSVPSAVQRTPLRLLLVGRLSPRKGTDVAVEAVNLLVQSGADVRLRIAGSTFDGYEWFEQDLRTRIDELGLAQRVTLLGFVHPSWAELEDADVVLVPSRVEPFGNTAVEAMLACRPVVASDVQGLAEVVRDGQTGTLVPPGDAAALAAALRRLADDPALRVRLATSGAAEAETRFSVARYADGIADALDDLLAGRRVMS